jgi:hypothetical protein
MSLAVLAGACDGREEGLAPVGGDTPSTVELERFVRRLHLDLTARPVDGDLLATAVADLEAAPSAVAARAELADTLLGSDDFGQSFVDELGNRVFGGDDPEDRYALICAIIRDDDPICGACAPPADGDPCADCDCDPLTAIHADRQAILDAAADLSSGDATTTEVERRFAESTALRAFSAPAALADQLFELFVGRPAEADEQVNVEAMIVGAILPDTPAGLLFHRHGSSYADLLDIVFESEVYREAAVGVVFSRYLGRPASLAEMAHFVAELAADETADTRPVVRAVVSSQEYFEQ